MMRSLFSGVSGLKTHQTRMDVIGNNIANVNTTAYKSSSMVFSDLMSQTTQKASGPNATTGTGGVNARQIGLGVKGGAISMNITGQGSSQSTGNPFDIMITGENFFVVSDGNSNFFTRDGSFYVDGAGNLAMTSIGYNVMGWGVDEETGMIKKDTVAALRIMSAANMTYPPEATTKANITGIIDKFDTDVTSSNGKTVNLNFFDNLGYSYTARITFKQDAENNKYSMEFNKLLDSKGNEVPLTEEQKMAILGGSIENGVVNAISKEQKGEVTLKIANYKWSDNTANATLQDNNGDPVVVRGEPLTGTGANTTRILYRRNSVTAAELDTDEKKLAEHQKALEEIAKAYGYEGDLDNFLSRRVVTDATTTPPTEKDLKTLLLGNPNASPAVAGVALAQALDEGTAGKGVVSSGRSYYGYEVIFDKGSDNGKIESVGGDTINFLARLNLASVGLGENFKDIEIDMSQMSMCDNKGTSTATATAGSLQNLGTGRRLGDMIGVSIQNNGMIYASYDNGMTRLLGQIATASFPNASGLEKYGDNLYTATLNSGSFDGIGVDITANGGYMSTGQLEMSNVDLSSEFTTMITTQRGFQANSRIITVSDTLLEELTNLKR